MPTATSVWKVKFCPSCSRAYDVLHKGCRTAEFCPDCKRERKTGQQLRRRELVRA